MSHQPAPALDLAARTLRLRAWIDNRAAEASSPFAGWAEPEIGFLARGESYEAWSVRHGGEHLVVRIAHRSPADLPRPMQNELTALALLPDDVGPRVFEHGTDDAELGAAYMVMTFVPGRVLDAAGWTDDLLARHAARLARLHLATARRPAAQPAGRERVPGPGPLAAVETPLERLDGALRWFGATGPVMDDAFARLLGPVRAYLEQREPAFAAVDRWCLVHGDLLLPNILVDDAGEPRYVDWEWAQLGDPAHDLGLIGGAVAADPWHVPLSPDRVRRFVLAYADALAEQAPGGAGHWGGPDDLLLRRDAWHVAEAFTSGLYYATMRGTPSDLAHGDRYTRAARAIVAGLTRLLRP